MIVKDLIRVAKTESIFCCTKEMIEQLCASLGMETHTFFELYCCYVEHSDGSNSLEDDEEDDDDFDYKSAKLG